MKPVISAICILSLVTALCFYSSNKIGLICKETETFVESLPEKTDGVIIEDCQNAVDKWVAESKFMCFFMSSHEISAVEESLLAVKNSVAVSSDDEFAAAKAQLTVQLKLMRESENLSLENIF